MKVFLRVLIFVFGLIAVHIPELWAQELKNKSDRYCRIYQAESSLLLGEIFNENKEVHGWTYRLQDQKQVYPYQVSFLGFREKIESKVKFTTHFEKRSWQETWDFVLSDDKNQVLSKFRLEGLACRVFIGDRSLWDPFFNHVLLIVIEANEFKVLEPAYTVAKEAAKRALSPGGYYEEAPPEPIVQQLPIVYTDVKKEKSSKKKSSSKRKRRSRK